MGRIRAMPKLHFKALSHKANAVTDDYELSELDSNPRQVILVSAETVTKRVHDILAAFEMLRLETKNDVISDESNMNFKEVTSPNHCGRLTKSGPSQTDAVVSQSRVRLANGNIRGGPVSGRQSNSLLSEDSYERIVGQVSSSNLVVTESLAPLSTLEGLLQRILAVQNGGQELRQLFSQIRGGEPANAVDESDDPRAEDEQMKLDQNLICADCGRADSSVSWCSLSLGIYLCLACAGKHRGLGVQISFVRSCSMDKWSCRELLRMVAAGGNYFFKQRMGQLLNTTSDINLAVEKLLDSTSSLGKIDPNSFQAFYCSRPVSCFKDELDLKELLLIEILATEVLIAGSSSTAIQSSSGHDLSNSKTCSTNIVERSQPKLTGNGENLVQFFSGQTACQGSDATWWMPSRAKSLRKKLAKLFSERNSSLSSTFSDSTKGQKNLKESSNTNKVNLSNCTLEFTETKSSAGTGSGSGVTVAWSQIDQRLASLKMASEQPEGTEEDVVE